MKLIVLSDIHIQDQNDTAYAALLQILKTQCTPGDVLVLAGDIFDLFVGNKDIFKNRFGDFLSTLKQVCENGTQVHYIQGNHDFHLSSVFKNWPGFFLHSSGFEITLAEKRFWIAHGDLVDLEDFGYLVLRGFFRSPAMQVFVALAPDPWIEWIGQTSSKKSSEKSPRLPEQLPQNQLEAMRKKYRDYALKKLQSGYDFVILGHCHDLDEAHTGRYMNMGFPKVHGSYISWQPGKSLLERKPFFISKKTE